MPDAMKQLQETLGAPYRRIEELEFVLARQERKVRERDAEIAELREKIVEQAFAIGRTNIGPRVHLSRPIGERGAELLKEQEGERDE